MVVQTGSEWNSSRKQLDIRGKLYKMFVFQTFVLLNYKSGSQRSANSLWPWNFTSSFQIKRVTRTYHALSTCMVWWWYFQWFLDPEGSPKRHSSCCSCWYQFSKNPLSFLNMQHNETLHTHSCWHSPQLQAQIFSCCNSIISVIKVQFMLSI